MNESTFTAECACERLDIYISEKLGITRSAVKKLIDGGNVTLNGKAPKSSAAVKTGDVVHTSIPDPVVPDLTPEDIPIRIVYEDGDIAVIDKPQGLTVHAGNGNLSGTLVNALMYHCGDSLSSINGVIRPGIVHRIDKDTSGLLMVAKNDRAHGVLSRQLADHSLTRRYRAIVYNNIKEDEGTIDRPIGRDPANRLRNAVTDANSRRAVTHYRVLERFGDFTLIEAQLETGRTHQIRVHMAYIKHPLLGDDLYGPRRKRPGVHRQMLHAGVLGFVHPSTGEYMEFSSPLPEDFRAVLEKLRKRDAGRTYGKDSL